MKRLKEVSNPIETRASRITELSDTDIERVAGGATCWLWGTSAGSGTGWYPHSAYPVDA